MKRKLNDLLDGLEFFLNHAPIENDCAATENQMYSNMVNLKNSIEDYLNDSTGDKNGNPVI